MATENGKISTIFKEGFLRGIAWSFGVTVGFALISTILLFILQTAGGLPFVGYVVADIVEATQSQLMSRSPQFR